MHDRRDRAEQPLVVEQPGSAVTPYASPGQPSFSATCSERCTCSGARGRDDRCGLVARHRPHRGGRGRRRRPAAAQALACGRLPSLYLTGRPRAGSPEAPADVARVEQRASDARPPAAPPRAAMRVASSYGVRRLVEVVELPLTLVCPAATISPVGHLGPRSEVGLSGVEPLRHGGTSARARSRTCPARAAMRPQRAVERRGCGR